MKDIDITNFEIQVSNILINGNYTNNKSTLSSIRYSANIRTTTMVAFNVHVGGIIYMVIFYSTWLQYYMITNLTSHEHMCYKTNFENIS